MRRFTGMLFFVFFSSAVFSQKKITFPVNQLKVEWTPVQNEFQNKFHSLNKLTITNNSSVEFPSSGWKMYFNSARLIEPLTVSGNANIEFVNGDLFRLSPGAGFKVIKPGNSVEIDFIADDLVVNTSDGPEGIYLVWDDQPEHGLQINQFAIGSFKPVYKGLVSPAVLFDLNKGITDIPEDKLMKVFPTPLEYAETPGFFNLTSSVQLMADSLFIKEKLLLAGLVETLIGKNRNTDKPPGLIHLEFKKELSPEGYELEIIQQKITLRASTETGMFYGIQSIRMIVPPSAWAKTQSVIPLQNLRVKDEPRFGYRAFMLDVGRNFQPKQEVMKLLDLMALYKINQFHFHLTEDEGWRLEIPSLPELTEVGARRGHTTDSKYFLPASHGSGPDTSLSPGSGFYSRKDFIEILRYANARHINVLTEIETPGHARAAIKSMNARYRRLMGEGKKEEASYYLLYDAADSSKYSSNQYWNDNIIDPSLPSTYHFIQTVIDDIVDMYKKADVPLKSIHFGGDEVPDHVWEKSPAYTELKKTHPEIKNTSDLWYYFYGRVNQMVKAKGLYLSGWEEMALRKTTLDGKPFYLPNPDFASEHLQADVWNNTLGGGNEDLAYKLANGGYKVVLTNVTNLYFDMAYYKSFDEPGYYWGAFIDIDKPFSFIPYDYFKNASVDKEGLPLNRDIFIGKQRLTDYGKTNIVGLQSAVWGENIKSTGRFEYMLLPRLLGFAERAWSKDPEWAKTTDSSQQTVLYSEAWSSFLNIIGKRQMPLLDYYDGGWGYRIPKPGVRIANGKYEVNIQFPGLVIRYTQDGSEPGLKSSVFSSALPEIQGKTPRFRAFNTKGRGGVVTE